MNSVENPLRFGTHEQFGTVRRLFCDTGYSATNICARLGVERLGLFEALQPLAERSTPQDALDLLISLFALGESVIHEELSQFLSNSQQQALIELGLLQPFRVEQFFAPVSVGPVDELFFVSDRWNLPDGSPFQIADDAVYPAITPNTLKFLDTVPQASCEALLDVGTGTGVGALLGAAAYAKHAWAVDVTARSALFARFNARLNGIANVTVGQGDLYEPVNGLTFDRIIAHPPYVPVLTRHWAFHDGGDDGELLTRRLIEGLPNFLRPGGVFHCYAMGSDRELPYERRMRDWLGESHAEFDVQLVVKNQMEPMQFGMQNVLKHDDSNADLGKWRQLFRQYHVRKLLFGTMTIRRLEESRKCFTVRRMGGERSTRAEAEWLSRVEAALATDDAAETVLQWRPRLASTPSLLVRHTVEDGEFTPSHYEVQTQYPFLTDAEMPAWSAVFLARCKGERTTAELLEDLKSDGYVQKQVAPKDFATLVASFISLGFLEVVEMPLPNP